MYSQSIWIQIQFMQDRINQIREALKNKHRETSRNAKIAESRQRVIEEAQGRELLYGESQLTLSKMRELLSQQPPAFSQLSILSINPSNNELIRGYMPEIIASISENSRRLDSWVLLGDLCGTGVVERKDAIDSQITSACVQYVLLQDDPETTDAIFRVLAKMMPLCDTEGVEIVNNSFLFSPEILQKYAKQFGESENFISFLAALEGVDQGVITGIVNKRFKQSEKEKVLEDILETVQGSIGQTITQDFFELIIRITQETLVGDFTTKIKKLAIESVGLACNAKNELIDALIQSSLIDDLIFRSKIDQHEVKLCILNILSQILILSNSEQIIQLIQNDFVEVLVRSLNYPNAEDVIHILKAIVKLLLEDYKQLLMSYRVEFYLNKLQFHENPHIYELASKAIDEFFNEEFVP